MFKGLIRELEVGQNAVNSAIRCGCWKTTEEIAERHDNWGNYLNLTINSEEIKKASADLKFYIRRLRKSVKFC